MGSFKIGDFATLQLLRKQCQAKGVITLGNLKLIALCLALLNMEKGELSC